MREVICTNKMTGDRELVILGPGMRVYINRDDDPETIVVFPTGAKVAYKEPVNHFAPRGGFTDASERDHRTKEREQDD